METQTEQTNTEKQKIINECGKCGRKISKWSISNYCNICIDKMTTQTEQTEEQKLKELVKKAIELANKYMENNIVEYGMKIDNSCYNKKLNGDKK